MSRKLDGQRFGFRGRTFFLAGCQCAACEGFFFVPAYTRLEHVPPEICPFCGARFVAVDRGGGRIEDLHPNCGEA